MNLSLKTFLAILAVSMLTIGTLTPAMAVGSETYDFEDNLEVLMPDVAREHLYVPGEILVKFGSGVSEAKIAAMNSKHGTSVTYTSPYAGFKKLKIPKTMSVEEMVEIYSKNPNVEYAIPNYIMYATMTPSDPLYSYQWNFYSGNGINVEPAWDISTGNGVIVAVVDTGIAQNAPDLAETKFTLGYDFINDDNDPADDNGHGTHVAGTIAQSTNNGEGVAGIAFDCTLMPVKVLDRRGSGNLLDLLDGIAYATDNGADVISMSLGFPPGINPDGLDDAINYAYDNGVTVVAAAGNDGTGTVSYPAASQNCIAVGATDYNGDRAYYSNYGDALDIMAPGGDVTVDLNDDGYGDGILQNTFGHNPNNFGYYFYQGTSMATPHVSGVAALLIANGITGPDNVRQAIESNAKDIYSTGWDADSGYGIVDAYAALGYIAQPADNVPPTAEMTITPANANVNDTIAFDASGSSDADGSIISYVWDFGDGSATESGSSPDHVYSSSRTYDVTLTVTDDDGATGTDTGTVTISDATTPETVNVTVGVVTNERIAGKNTFVNGIATITVNVDDVLYPGASVSGHWSDAANDLDIATTDVSGTATVVSDAVKYKSGTLTFIFTVDSVAVDGTTYEVSESGTATYTK